MRRAADIEINVDRLVLHGGSTIERDELLAAMKQELSRLAARGAERRRPAASGPLAGDGDLTIEVPAGLDARDVGRRVASSIWSSWQGRGGRSSAPVSMTPVSMTPVSMTHATPKIRPGEADRNGKGDPS